MSAAAELRRVSKSYGSTSVLIDCDFILGEGERTALLGSSGCGKSTILRLMAGLEAPSGGTVFINGVLASQARRIEVPPHRRGITMVFQDLGLWPSLDVLDNVLLGLDGMRLPSATGVTAASKALETCGIGSLARRMPGTLSGGEQQRVALARAIAPDPDVLLLDEPFAGLDLVTKAQLLGDLARVLSERRLTICLVTHDPKEAFTLCTHCAVLERGRSSERGPWPDVLRAPQSTLLRHFREAYDRFGDRDASSHQGDDATPRQR